MRAGLRRAVGREPGSVMAAWMRGVTARRESDAVILNFGLKKVLLVSGGDLSRHILEQRPSSRGYVEGALKRKGMSFLAPHALTITHDEQWARLRRFHEEVLCDGRPHNDQQAFLGHVHRAFVSPIGSAGEIRAAMGRAMLGIVWGDGTASERLPTDVQALFGFVQSPIKRALARRWGNKRRAAFYGEIRQAWERAGESGGRSLAARAHRFADLASEEELFEQIPHWMFTFTGSGTDLLIRGLALVGSRPAVRDRALAEIAGAGPLDRPSSIAQLRFLEACLMESARLFPPVTQTFHRAPHGDVFDGVHIPAEMEIVHYLPLMYRDGDPDAHAFRPERWLDVPEDEPAVYPDPFLSGPRACPGKELILFVCKSAMAVLLAENGLRVECRALARDPLPLSFPDGEIQFRYDMSESSSRTQTPSTSAEGSP